MHSEPDNVEALCEFVEHHDRIRMVGGGTKAGTAQPREAVATVAMTGLSGLTEYEPQEYTVSARAGTRLREIEAALAEQSQYLPFDPPFADEGATIGGTVAAGLSGPGSVRHGVLRDFVIGIRFVDGRGVLVQGGGKVVKNAAGFDYPKLLGGSLGAFGVITDVTLKVFPKPFSTTTASFECGSFAAAVAALQRLTNSPLVCDGLQVYPDGRLLVRLGGVEGSFPKRIERVAEMVAKPSQLLEGSDDATLWSGIRDLSAHPRDAVAVKIPTSTGSLLELEGFLQEHCDTRFYGQGGAVAWVVTEGDLDALAIALQSKGITALALRGREGPRFLGQLPDQRFIERIRAAFDPDGRFTAVRG